MPFLRFTVCSEASVKIGEDVVKNLEAFDLLQSYRAAAKFVGCDHHTLKKYVQLWDAGKPTVTAQI